MEATGRAKTLRENVFGARPSLAERDNPRRAKCA